MTSTRSRVALACLLLAVTTGAGSAQTRRAQTPPATQPPVEAEADRPPVEQDPDRTSGFRRPIVRIFQDYTLRPNDAVREVRTVFGNAVIEGDVDYDVVVVMGSARVTGTGSIGGALVVVGGGAEIAEEATVEGDLVVVGGVVRAPATFSPGGEHVVIGTPLFGEVMRDVLPWVSRGLIFGRLIVPDLEWVWVVVGVFFLIYLALNTAFDRPVAATADVATERPIGVFFGGLLVLLLAVPVFAILAATVIGLAVVPFLICALIVAALVGKTAVARAIGRGVVRAQSPEGRLAAMLAFIIGFVLLTLAYMVPVLGFVTWALTSVLGLGAATATLRGHLRRERKVAAPAAPVAAPPPDVVVPPLPPPPIAQPLNVDAEMPPPPPPIVPPAAVFEPPPPPAPPRFTHGLASYPRATFLDRLAAFVLDCILVAIANGMLELDRHNDGLFFFLLLVYHIAFWAWKGTTLGGIICNLRVTRTDGTALRPVDAVVRGLSGIFSIAALGIGCFWMLQDPENQMWHDKIAGTLVVKVPREVVLA